MAISRPDKPVRDHFRHQHVQHHPAETGQQTPDQLRRPATAKRHDQAPDHHKHKAAQHAGLVAEAPAKRTARQSQYNAGRQVQPDQQAQIGQPDAKISAHQRAKRADGLELESHRRSNGEQKYKYTPAQRHGEPQPSQIRHTTAQSSPMQARHVQTAAMLTPPSRSFGSGAIVGF